MFEISERKQHNKLNNKSSVSLQLCFNGKNRESKFHICMDVSGSETAGAWEEGKNDKTENAVTALKQVSFRQFPHFMKYLPDIWTHMCGATNLKCTPCLLNFFSSLRPPWAPRGFAQRPSHIKSLCLNNSSGCLQWTVLRRLLPARINT